MIVQLNLDDMRGPKPAVEPACGCWIAGGAVRAWFTGGEKVSDIDVFGPSLQATADFVNSLFRPKLVGAHSNAETYLVYGSLVQVIKLFKPNIDELLYGFDYNVCQFAWTGEGIFATQEAIIGALRGHLAVGRISHDFAMDSLRRAFKYQKKGYAPCAGTLRDIANALRKLSDEDVKNQVEISPSGGKRTVHMD